MSEHNPTKIPHFLRVVRALAKVSSVAIPVTALITTVTPGCGDGTEMGVPAEMSSSSSSSSGGPVGLVVPPDAGNDGGPVGVAPAPDAGNDGGPVGLPPAPDAGDGG
jgi:hypothetical protein